MCLFVINVIIIWQMMMKNFQLHFRVIIHKSHKCSVQKQDTGDKNILKINQNHFCATDLIFIHFSELRKLNMYF